MRFSSREFFSKILLINILLAISCSNPLSASQKANGALVLLRDTLVESLDSLPPVADVNTSKALKASFTYSVVAAGTPLILGSFLSFKFADNSFQMARSRAIPSFRNHYDDYAQYFPLALSVGFGAISGDYGSLSGREFFTAYAASYSLIAAIVLPTKQLIDRLRPDDSAFNSFPSGHTATAFAGAELLDLVYGEAHPLLSALGYSAACITAMGRVLNERHWVSDVFAGATLGILSSDLGYYLATWLWKDNPNALGYERVETPSEGTWLWAFANAMGTGGNLSVRTEEANTLLSERVRIATQLLYRFSKKEGVPTYTTGFGIDLSASPSDRGETRLAPYLIAEAASSVTGNSELGLALELGVSYPVQLDSKRSIMEGVRGEKMSAPRAEKGLSMDTPTSLGWRISLFGDLYVRPHRGYRLFLAVGNMASVSSNRRNGSHIALLSPQFEFGCSMRLFP